MKVLRKNAPDVRRKLAIALVPALWLAMSGSAQAALLAYDGFAAGGATPSSGQYVSEPASTNGTNNDSLFGQGPALTGFSGNWTGTAGNYAASVYYRINEAGLTYGDLQTTSGQVELFRSSGSNASTKPLSRTTDFVGGESVYFSLLLNYNHTHGTEVKFFPGANSVSMGTNSDGQANVRYAGSQLGFSASAISLNETHLLVLRINDDDTFTFWLDPTDLSNEGANTPVVSGSGVVYATGSSFTSLQFISTAENGGNSTIFDEIRIGNSWADVLPIPEPSSGALILLALLGFTARWRKRLR